MLRTVRYALLAAAIAGGALTCAAQAKHKGRQLKRPTEARAGVADRWKPFSSKEGGFQVSFPGVPKQSSMPVERMIGTMPLHVATYEAGVIYSVMYTRFSLDLSDANEVKDYFDNLRIGELESPLAGATGARVLSETDMPLGPYPGRLLHLDMKEKEYRRRAVLAQGWIYILTAAAPKGTGGASEAKRYERLSMKFLNSLELKANESQD